MSKIPVLLVLLFIGFCCCLGAICVLSGGLAVIGIALPGSPVEEPLIQSPQATVPPVLLPTPTTASMPATAVPADDSEITRQGVVDAVMEPEPRTPAEETLQTLKDTIVPVNDQRDLAMRLLGIPDIPETLDPPEVWPTQGSKRQFYVQNVVTNQSFQVNATLQYLGDHLYFWVQDGVSFRASELDRLARTFDQEIYPTTRAFFGSEWNPGIDQDPRLHILYAGGLGGRIAGYFSSSDSVHPLAHKYSNGVEMFLLNADTVGLGEEFAYSVLAHEFQHMIHWYQDRNEASWLDEGFSELAAFLNGYGGGGFDYLYTSDPSIQLNDWPNVPGGTTPHYGASFLFVTYILDRFGNEAVQALVAHPENGLESLDAVLEELEIVDPVTGEAIRADHVFADWALANYLRDPKIGDGRYTYHNYPYGPRTTDTEVLSGCVQALQDRTIKQYGVQYLRVNCGGSYTIRFEGEQEVGVIPADPYSGDYAFWSNKGDQSDMTLTRTFDFRSVTGPLTLTYWTWYDIEKDYDYVYLVASEDGLTWDILQTPRGTDEDPSGNSFGWGYNGESGGWVQEQVDLSRFAGKQVQLRFEYITDAAVHGEGMLLDDIAIPQIDYFSDFEEDEGGWRADGFVRLQNRLPQSFTVSVIQIGSGTGIQTYHISDGESLQLKQNGAAVLVVSGTTRFTRQEAEYRFSVSQ